MRYLPAVLLSTLATAPAWAVSPYRVTSLSAPGPAQYLIIAADSFADSCDRLLEHRRAGGLSVAVVAYSDVLRACPGQAGPQAITAFLTAAAGRWQTTWCLLVGDCGPNPATGIPLQPQPSAYYTDRFLSEPTLATDYDYGTLGGEGSRVHVGRFPVQDAAQVHVAITKTLAYETSASAGPWQRRLAFIMGQSGFNALVDSALEALFSSMVVNEIPPQYDLELAYAKPSSPYAPYPPRFNENAVRLLNQGELLFVYVGHGQLTGTDSIQWQGTEYPILEATDLQRVSVAEGLPVMVVIACSTAEIDSPRGDALAETVLAQPSGPVAFIGAARVCQPYGNALLGRGLVNALLVEDHATLGEAFDRARELVLAPDDSPARRKVDALAGLIQGAASLPLIRQDTVRHYILLGDPALKLRRPTPVAVAATQVDGPAVSVRADVPFADGTAWVSVECPRDEYTGDLPRLPRESAADYGARMDERYRQANDKRWAQVAVPVQGGKVNAVVPLPAGMRTGRQVVRVVAWSAQDAAAGAAEVDIRR
jgi:hypothetical protein